MNIIDQLIRNQKNCYGECLFLQTHAPQIITKVFSDKTFLKLVKIQPMKTCIETYKDKEIHAITRKTCVWTNINDINVDTISNLFVTELTKIINFYKERVTGLIFMPYVLIIPHKMNEDIYKASTRFGVYYNKVKKKYEI